jgi:hypothetical protein
MPGPPTAACGRLSADLREEGTVLSATDADPAPGPAAA